MNIKDYRLSSTEIILILFFGMIATIYILTGAYIGVTGHHIWRQADVYGHILGFMGYKNFQPFDSFIMGTQNVFDIPIYQWIIAKTALLLHFDPLVVTTVFNYILWIVTTLFGYLISDILGKRFAGLSFLFFMTTSPLILHYYSVPLPDTLSIALSMVAIAIFFSCGMSYRSVLLSTPFLLIATLIKSPIVFIFILFYLSYRVFFKNISFSTPLGTTIKENFSLLLLFVLLLISAILAELLRKYFMGELDGLAFAQDPSWYFGSLKLRMSSDFWYRILKDLDHSSIYPFSIIYLVTVSLSLFIHKERTLVAVISAAVLSFLTGWLIFSNLYFQNDYYKLPVTIVLFISLSVALSYSINYFDTNYIRGKFSLHKSLTILIIIVATLSIVLTQDYISDRGASKERGEVKESLKGYDSFIVIAGGKIDNPVLGAQLGTKYMIMGAEEFDRNCLENLYKYKAIVTINENQCITKNRHLFNNIIHFDKSKVLYTVDPLESKLHYAKKMDSHSTTQWNIYKDKNSIILYKSPCKAEETNNIYFFRFSPKYTTDKSTNDFIHKDLKFDSVFRENSCLAYKELPSYVINAATVFAYSNNRKDVRVIGHWEKDQATTK